MSDVCSPLFTFDSTEDIRTHCSVSLCGRFPTNEHSVSLQKRNDRVFFEILFCINYLMSLVPLCLCSSVTLEDFDWSELRF